MLPLIPPLARKTKFTWGVSQLVWAEHTPSRTTFKMLATALSMGAEAAREIYSELTAEMFTRGNHGEDDGDPFALSD